MKSGLHTRFRPSKDHVVIAFLALTILWAWFDVLRRYYRQSTTPSTTGDQAIVIRLAHWQLEPGFRQAIDEAADDYRRLVNPNFYLVQEAIPEGTYGQWVTSQLIGGTAPDLIAPGQGLQAPIWISYLNRYFLPITDKLAEPNPHNKGTALEGVPFNLTFKDQMRSGYLEDLQAQYGVPLYIHSARLFYNKQLLYKLTGRTEPPAILGDFIETCNTIAAHRDPNGRPYTPIAASGYHANMWDNILDHLTYKLLPKVDVNRDGYASAEEFFVAVRQNWVDFNDPIIGRRLAIFPAIARYFQPGWLGLTRDEAVFLFAQQRAVFISVGTWDARSLQEQANGLFDIKVVPFPWPARDDPDYGPLVVTEFAYDRPNYSMGFAITRSSKHPEVAFDFLRYLASLPGNEKFTDTIGWIPGVVGARLPEFLAGFNPELQGQYNALLPTLGGRTDIVWNQQYQLVQIGQLSPTDLQTKYASLYATAGLEDFRERMRNTGRAIRNAERFIAGIRGELINATPENHAYLAHRYATRVGSRQILAAADAIHLERLASSANSTPADPAGPPSLPPYTHRPEVLARARQRLLTDANAGRPPIHEPVSQSASTPTTRPAALVP